MADGDKEDGIQVSLKPYTLTLDGDLARSRGARQAPQLSPLEIQVHRPLAKVSVI